MTKKYKCIVGSPEIPKGSIVEREGLSYALYIQGVRYSTPKGTPVNLDPWQVEGNDCWELVEETISSTPTKRWKPILGQPFYCIDESGFVEEDEWDGTLGDERMWEIGNCFLTEQQARDEVKRRESIANAWRPKEGGVCWIWDCERSIASCFDYNDLYFAETYIGACHPTKEACQKWGETYAKYFLPPTE